MSTEVIVYVLTALAAVVVVLTRLRLSRERAGAARVEIARGPVGTHTVTGVLALVSWLVFLLADGPMSEGTASIVGIIALALWWVCSGCGLLILVRWLPSRGRHSADGTGDSWSEGPGLSLLGHLGMVVGVAVFTYAYLVGAV